MRQVGDGQPVRPGDHVEGGRQGGRCKGRGRAPPRDPPPPAEEPEPVAPRDPGSTPVYQLETAIG